MRRELVIYTFIATFILLLIPTIPAMEFSLVQNNIKDSLQQKIEQTLDATPVDKSLFKNIDFSSPGSILQHFLDKISKTKESLQSDDGGEQPLFFPFLGIFVYGFILVVILKVIGTIIKLIGGKINYVIQLIKLKITNAITKIITFITTLVTFVINIITYLVNLTITLLTNLFNLGVTIGSILFNAILLILTGIITIILMAVQAIINVIAKIWYGIGQIIRFFIDLIIVIIDAIFPNYQMIEGNL